AEEDGAPALDDHRLVAHGRDVGAPRGAGAEHDADLGDPGRAQASLVVEDAAEVLPVGKDLGLEGQEGPPGVHQVHAGQAVLARATARCPFSSDSRASMWDRSSRNSPGPTSIWLAITGMAPERSMPRGRPSRRLTAGNEKRQAHARSLPPRSREEP